jgi:hypothetical protein
LYEIAAFFSDWIAEIAASFSANLFFSFLAIIRLRACMESLTKYMNKLYKLSACAKNELYKARNIKEMAAGVQ